MKKSELYNLIDTFVEREINEYAGEDTHVVEIPVEKNENITICGVYGKRGIDGVVVCISDPELDDYIFYDVTSTVIEHPTKDGGYFKESSFEDKDVAVKSMYDTIIASLDNIECLLNTPYQDLIDGDSKFNKTEMCIFAFY